MTVALEDLESHLTSLSPPTSTSPSIPGVVLLATTKDPTTPPYSFSCGVASVAPSRAPAPPLSPNSTFWFASATKLLSSITALQLVDDGLWTLDRPVAEALPELASLRELTGCSEAGEPVYAQNETSKPAGTRITLRHLLTHTSGLAYDFLNPKLTRWWKWRAEKEGRNVRAEISGTVRGEYGGPLVREPGTAWEYGPGIDWAGALVERLHDVEPGRLGRVIQKQVFDKVGVDEGEAVWRRADLKWSDGEIAERWVDMTMRSKAKGLVPTGLPPPANAHDDLGGAGIRCPAQAWLRVLESLLRNDGRLLRRETAADFLFTPQLADGRDLLGANLGSSLQAFFASGPGGRMLTGGLPSPSTPGGGVSDADEFEFNHSLAGALSRKKGQQQWALHWGGMPNVQWFIDPAEGVAGLFATQTLPPADPLMLDLAWKYRRSVIEAWGSGSRGEGRRGWQCEAAGA